MKYQVDLSLFQFEKAEVEANTPHEAVALAKALHPGFKADCVCTTEPEGDPEPICLDVIGSCEDCGIALLEDDAISEWEDGPRTCEKCTPPTRPLNS